ncbi:hypothetical protein [Antribacter gilvus]|uniref:hypothetical protein n=1 Tax=Antribacter gilvus TaxID=2304675 RepID=UPI000F7AC4A2|nr:hypothetical protein [Antribacter gilvus]
MAVLRTNVVTDPRATVAANWTSVAGTGGVVSETMVVGATDGPTLPDGTKATTYARYTYTTANTGGVSSFGYSIPNVNLGSWPSGTPFVAGIWVRTSVPVTLGRVAGYQQTAAFSESSINGPSVAIPANTWTYLAAAFVSTVVAGAFGSRFGSPSQIFPLGATVDVTCALAEPDTSVVGAYIDGDTTDSPDRRYDWTGPPHASTSTESTRLDLEVVETTEPKPVRITTETLVAGTRYRLVGVTADGQVWDVPGGTFTAASAATVTLVDNRTALNAVVTYRMLSASDGVVLLESVGSVVIDCESDIVLQSLDGAAVAFVDLANLDLSRTGQPRFHESDVAGRRDRPARYDVALADDQVLVVEAEGAQTLAVQAMLVAGGPIVMRSTPGIGGPLFPASQLVRAASWSSRRIGFSSLYQWSLTVAGTSDPEPSRAVALNSWADFNAAMVRLGWDYTQLNDFLAGLGDWESFSTVDWKTL